jgi:uncharacterized protein (DUF433 family)
MLMRRSDGARVKALDVGRSQVDDAQLLERITASPDVMTGKTVIRGTRLTVEYILNLLAHGSSEEEILAEYSGLAVEDVRACVLFAVRVLQDSDFMPLMAESA